jgi:hypothetical protein
MSSGASVRVKERKGKERGGKDPKKLAAFPSKGSKHRSQEMPNNHSI